jgi:DNA polymerase-3 subunit delta'
MNAAAQNALLKTLEEPPENSLIILITPNGGELLPTLRSRCLRLSFAPLPRTQVAEFLKRNGGASDLDGETVAAMAMGSIGRAVSLKNGEWMDKRRGWGAIVGRLNGKDYQEAMAEAETLASDREEALEFFRWLESWFRDLLVYGVTREQERIANRDMLPEIEQQARGFGSARALRVLEEIAAASAAIQRNLNRRMVLEKFFFTLMEAR